MKVFKEFSLLVHATLFFGLLGLAAFILIASLVFKLHGYDEIASFGASLLDLFHYPLPALIELIDFKVDMGNQAVILVYSHLGNFLFISYFLERLLWWIFDRGRYTLKEQIEAN